MVNTALDRLIPLPRLVEVDHVDLAAPPQKAWELVRHGELARSPLVRALFVIRDLPNLVRGEGSEPSLRIDSIRSSEAEPGFAIFADDAPHEVAAGAIGKVWHAQIPFVHVPDVERFVGFHEPDYAKVAWAARVLPRGDAGSRVEVEVRVDTTDEAAWAKFKSYFRVIGPGSRFIRHALLAWLAHELGDPSKVENERPIQGDDLLPECDAQLTHAIDLRARPEAIWPWLVQMGGRRAGFYSIDMLDNAAVRSAREIHPELGTLRVGEVVPATPDGDDGFEVLRVDPPRVLLFGGLFDATENEQLAFSAPRPESFWQVTWAFVLEPLDAATTRLHVRARAAYSRDRALHAAWIRPVHHLMERAQLENLRARVEGQLPADDWHDVLEGVGGAAIMASAFLTPFLRDARNHFGVTPSVANRSYPGDDLVRSPRWTWTHGIEIDAPAEAVWPWVAQIGADRGGFYSYQWLENVAGCGVRNAETVHADWQVRVGDALRLHPKMPGLEVVSCERGRCFVAHGPPDVNAVANGAPWVAVTWAFLVEPLGADRCRFISRYRCATSDHFSTRAAFGPTLLEPVGFAMDRRMLIGVKERAEGALAGARSLPNVRATT